MLSADEPRAFALKRHNAAFFLISALTALIAAQPSAAPSVLALEHVTVIDVATGRLHRDMTVLIEGSHISAVEPAATIKMPGAARIVPARGKYLSPGFVETHAHWFVWFRDRPDPVHAAGRGAGVYLANGITTMIDVAGQRNQDQATLKMRAAVAALGVPAPRILVSGRVDAPAVTRSGATDAGELTRRLLALGVDGIKIHRGLTESDLRAVVAETHRASRRVYGHTYEMVDSVYHDYTRLAVEAGVDGVFHVLGLAPVRSDREPRPPAKSAGWQAQAEWLYMASRWLSVDEASADALIALMVQQGTWLQPTLVTEELTAHTDWYHDSPYWKYSPLPRLEAGEKSGWPAFKGADLARYRQSYARMQWFVRRFYEAGGLVLTGTDGVPIHGFGLQEELRLLVKAGLPPLAALQAATLNPARAFGLDDSSGTVERGKLADLVLLDANPLQDIRHARRISGVVRNGEYFDRTALDTLLAHAERK